MMRPPPSLYSTVSAALVLAFGPRFLPRRTSGSRTRGARSAALAGASRLGARMGHRSAAPTANEDDAENQEEGGLVQFREDWTDRNPSS
jgi:hypothetical protein